MVELEDESDLPVAELSRGAAIEIGVARAVEPDVAAARRVEGAKQVQQRALPRPGGADDGDELAAPHVEVDAAQHLEGLAVAARVDLPDRPGLEQRVHS